MILYIVIVALLIYLWFQHKYSFWEKRGFPSIPGRFPLGSVGELGYTVHSSDLFKKFYNDHKGKFPAVGMYFMTQPVLLPTEPELVKEILVRNFESFHDHGFYEPVEKDDPLCGHLFFLKGQRWKELRAKLSPTFTSGKIKMMFGNVAKVCDGLVEYLKPTADENGVLEMKEVLAAYGTEVISSVAFGFETKCLGNPNNEFRKVAKAVFSPPKWETIKFFFMNSFENFSRALGLTFNTKETTKFFMEVIRSTLDYRETNNIQRNDFLQLLIQIKNSEAGMTFNEIAANSFVFFLAGFESSSSVATFTLYELALNQDIQDRLRNEIDEVLSKHEDEINYDGVMEMKYLDMVLNETLRKYPVNDKQFRKCSNDFRIPNSELVIPRNTLIIISSQALHHDERFYDNPSKFDPERFSEQNIKKLHPFTYIPFSDGPRMCIGSRFGMMQTKLAVVKLLQKFRFVLCDKTTIPMKFVPSSTLQSPVGGMWLKVENVY